jgi:hypothetical protein
MKWIIRTTADESPQGADLSIVPNGERYTRYMDCGDTLLFVSDTQTASCQRARLLPIS